MTFSRVERLMLLGMGYIVLIALAAIVWPKGSDTPSKAIVPASVPYVASPSPSDFWTRMFAKPSPMPSVTPTPSVSATVAPQTYVVVAGDSPQVIETKTSFPWAQIYALNGEQIESVARLHGLTGSQNGTYLYPGEALVLPSGH